MHEKVRSQKRGAVVFRPTEIKILEALAVYRFMTAEQLARVGAAARTHIHDTLRTLSRRKPHMVHMLDFGVRQGIGRLARLYALTPHGASVIADYDAAFGDLLTHRHLNAFAEQYEHRVGCVDFHIRLRQWAAGFGATVNFFDADYDPVSGGGPGKQPTKKTHIPMQKHGAIIPDAIFSVTDNRSVVRLYAFELYRRKHTARVVEQLEPYLDAFTSNAIENRYQYPNAVRVLVLFDSSQGMELVCERLRQHPGFRHDKEAFHLASEERVKADITEGWQLFDGRRAEPFP